MAFLFFFFLFMAVMHCFRVAVKLGQTRVQRAKDAKFN